MYLKTILYLLWCLWFITISLNKGDWKFYSELQLNPSMEFLLDGKLLDARAIINNFSKKFLMQVDSRENEESIVPIAFILINTKIGLEKNVLSKIVEVEGVEEAHAVYGVYDVIAKIRAASMNKIKEIVTWHIRRIENVRSTLTMLVIE